jgi:hypothetical protein
MHQAEFDVTYTEARNRGTTAIRIILAIPHLILAYVWNIAAEVAAIIQWFICVFTGKRNKALWDFANNYVAYSTRVYSYVGLMHDVFPAFGTEQGRVPTRYHLEYDEPANRLTVGLRLIWLIPAAIIGFLFAIAAMVLAIISWFAIVITGKHPKGMWDFMLKANKYLVQVVAYEYLLTDKYPSTAMPPPTPTPAYAA